MPLASEQVQSVASQQLSKADTIKLRNKHIGCVLNYVFTTKAIYLSSRLADIFTSYAVLHYVMLC